MKIFPYAILIITLFTTACAPLIQLPPDNSFEKKVLLPFRIDTILVVDLRPDTTNTTMKLPLISVRQEEWIVKPSINNVLMGELIEMINQSSNPEGLPVKVTFSIKDGYYKISGNARSVGEHTLFDCVIRFDLKASDRYWNSSAQAFYDYVGVFNATEKHAKDIYRITVRNSVYKALKQGESVFDNISH